MTVQTNINEIKLNLSEEIIGKMKKDKLKKTLKQKIINASYEYLNQIKETHSKVQNIKYTHLIIQPYMNTYNII